MRIMVSHTTRILSWNIRNSMDVVRPLNSGWFCLPDKLDITLLKKKFLWKVTVCYNSKCIFSQNNQNDW